MSSAIYYKFKSKKESSKIVFDGSSISIKDLRTKIILHSGLKADDMVLKIERTKDQCNDSKDAEYKDDEIVKKFTTVIVSRMPCSRKEQTRSSKIRNPEVLHRKDPYKAITNEKNSAKFHEMSKAANLYDLDVSEDAKIDMMMRQSTDSYIVERNPRHPMHPPGPAPINYMCFKCKMTGHYVSQCPGVKDKDGNPVDMKNLKRPTGIPQDFLVEVEKDTPGAYLTKDGRYTIPAKDRDAFIKGKKEKRPFSEEENPVYTPKERKPVEEIVCPICRQVMRNAVFISCCGNSYCQECVTDYVFNIDVKGSKRCPNCDSPVDNADSFIPNPTIRDMVHKYNSGAVSLLSQPTIQVNDMVAPVQEKSVHSRDQSQIESKRQTAFPENPLSRSSVVSATSVAKSAKDNTQGKQSEKDTSATRGPFVDGRRVLKPKPPPEVVLVRRSDTLKTDINPAFKSNQMNLKLLESEKEGNQPEVELDLGIDEVSDPLFNDLSDKEQERKQSQSQTTENDGKSSKSKEEVPNCNPEDCRDKLIESQAPAAAGVMPVESISARTSNRFKAFVDPDRRENGRRGSGNDSRSAASEHLSSSASRRQQESYLSSVPKIEAAACPRVSKMDWNNALAMAMRSASIPRHLSIHPPQSDSNAMLASGYISNLRYANAGATSHVLNGGGLSLPANPAFGYNNGVAESRYPHHVVLPEQPILTEQQFNELRRELLRRECRGSHRRRSHGRSYSPGNSSSRSRRRRSRSPSSRRRRELRDERRRRPSSLSDEWYRSSASDERYKSSPSEERHRSSYSKENRGMRRRSPSRTRRDRSNPRTSEGFVSGLVMSSRERRSDRRRGSLSSGRSERRGVNQYVNATSKPMWYSGTLYSEHLQRDRQRSETRSEKTSSGVKTCKTMRTSPSSLGSKVLDDGESDYRILKTYRSKHSHSRDRVRKGSSHEDGSPFEKISEEVKRDKRRKIKKMKRDHNDSAFPENRKRKSAPDDSQEENRTSGEVDRPKPTHLSVREEESEPVPSKSRRSLSPVPDVKKKKSKKEKKKRGHRDEKRSSVAEVSDDKWRNYASAGKVPEKEDSDNLTSNVSLASEMNGPSSEWVLELDNNTDEFEEESRQEELKNIHGSRPSSAA